MGNICVYGQHATKVYAGLLLEGSDTAAAMVNLVCVIAMSCF